MGLGQLMIFVSTLEKAKAFYVELIGLEVAHDMSKEEGMLIMKNEGAFLTIHEGFQQAEIDRKKCRIVPIFKVTDIILCRENLSKHGVYLEGEIIETPVHRYQIAKDFDGNWIEVAQFKQ